MEITIKLNKKLIKQMLELKLNNGKKIEMKTFENLLSEMNWRYRETLKEVGEEMEFHTIIQLVKSYDFLENHLIKIDRINKHNKKMKLKEGEYKSGYWSYNEGNCCPKCNRYGSSLSEEGFEHTETYLKEKYQKEYGKNYIDILEFYGQCEKCGIGFTEVYSGKTYSHHEIQ